MRVPRKKDRGTQSKRVLYALDDLGLFLFGKFLGDFFQEFLGSGAVLYCESKPEVGR